MLVTRNNIDRLLDAGVLECAINSGRWWPIRRNGSTKRWKRDTMRLYLPIKYGMYGYNAITELDFDVRTGALYSTSYRVAPRCAPHVIATETVPA